MAIDVNVQTMTLAQLKSALSQITVELKSQQGSVVKNGSLSAGSGMATGTGGKVGSGRGRTRRSIFQSPLRLSGDDYKSDDLTLRTKDITEDPDYELSKVSRAIERENQSKISKMARGESTPFSAKGVYGQYRTFRRGLNDVGSWVRGEPTIKDIRDISNLWGRMPSLTVATPGVNQMVGRTTQLGLGQGLWQLAANTAGHGRGAVGAAYVGTAVIGAPVALAAVAAATVAAVWTPTLIGNKLSQMHAEAVKETLDARTGKHKAELQHSDRSGMSHVRWTELQDETLEEIRSRDQWKRDNAGGIQFQSNLRYANSNGLGGNGKWATFNRAGFNTLVAPILNWLTGQDETVKSDAEIEKIVSEKASASEKQFEELKEKIISKASFGDFANVAFTDKNMSYNRSQRDILHYVQQNAAKIFEGAEQAKQSYKRFTFQFVDWKKPRDD